MDSGLLYDHIDAVVAALKAATELNEDAKTLFGGPLLICRGSFFGEDNILGYDHAPFVAVFPGDDEAVSGVPLSADTGPVPRELSVRIMTGLPMDAEPVTAPPVVAERQAEEGPVVYVSGSGSEAEQFHYDVMRIASAVFSERGFTPSNISTFYSGSMRFPLETFDSTVRLSAPLTVTGGAF